MSDAAERDPVAEQEEAARLFEERTGRKSTDPAFPAFARMYMAANVRPSLTEVRLRVPAGTPINEALAALFSEPDAQYMVLETAEAADRYAGAIDVDSYERLDSESVSVSG